MGRIITKLTITNPLDPSRRIQCVALVDTGSAGLVLPAVWKERLGQFPLASRVQMETADQRIVAGEVCGPVIIQIEGFRPVSGEVTFLERLPKNGDYEPLLGYITLEQSQAAVDLARDRLVPVKYVDLKAAGEASFKSEIRNHGWPQMNTDRRREGHGRARSRLHARSAAI